MLEMRPDCQRCGCDLAPDSRDAHICSFECTFCDACTRGPLERSCPNCGGELRPRPARAAAWLEKHPGSTKRRYSAKG